MTQDYGMDSFKLGEPALVCRWRLAAGKLPLEGRHLRALGSRTVNGGRVGQPIVAWAQQHIEWTLEGGSEEHPNGVLMLVIDVDGQAAMTVGPFVPLEKTDLLDLLDRSEQAHAEAANTGVAPESLWLVQDGTLVWDDEPATTASGSASLVEGLAHTLGIPVRRNAALRKQVKDGSIAFDEAFLVSDEYGVVPAQDRNGDMARRFSEGYERLLAKMRS